MTHGFVHVEIPSADFDRTRNFYRELFEWKLDLVVEEDYMLFDTGEEVNGAFYHSPWHTGRQGIILYIRVDDIDQTLERVLQLGGKIIRGKTPEKASGSFALISDPDGNVLGIWQRG
ncbi:MAG: VOC family protein [candidate division KSB1 bacterium]|nr:VOC family protein [candidate division KSB1 bacterium]MDZ7273840.1 VOC family protein [candidate division KSB1 bacterium]MDZ7285996.1 VOC family protein [candidate division KSB1 bacterium]MDZ7299028.1 VOC family protein [candidate division KSB1 bacterium]MDZ7308001.1 VOC family protein [candidate division KSB1 bacterium]